MHGSIIIGGYSMSCIDCIYYRAGVFTDYCAFWNQVCIGLSPCLNWEHRSSHIALVNKSVDWEDAV